MLIDRYDKNGNQISVGDYLLRYDGEIFKVDFNPINLAVGIKDKDSNYFLMEDWIKEDWEIKSYEELFKEVLLNGI
jgi:hypothetical protein